MTGYGTGPFSTSSHATDAPGVFRARIETIDDPQKRNRVQIRIFGYQDDQGNIQKDQLEWVHCTSHDSQVPGATSTHNYYPGAEVFVMNTGAEKVIMGSIPGFDGEKRLSQNPWGVDSSDNQNSDVPNMNRQQPSDMTVRKESSSLMDPPEGDAGMKNYFNYQNAWSPNIVQNNYNYARGKGEVPAPWGEGDVSKNDQLKSIALQKNQQGSDILDVIKNLDGNQSGSVKSALDIIKNLRMNGWGNAMSVIGSGNVGAALGQYVQQYGTYTQNDLVNLLQQLLASIQFVLTLTNTNFYTNVNQNNINAQITFFQNVTFNISSDILNDMISINNNVSVSSNNADISYYTTQLGSFLSDYNTAVSQAFTNIVVQINAIAATAGDVNSFISIFGGPILFAQFSQLLLNVGQYVGLPVSAINNIGLGSIGLGLANNLPQTSNQNNNNSNSGSGGNSIGLLMGLLAMFKGNGIATQEVMSGGLIKQFLSNNPRKYQQKEQNDGMSVLKKFQDGVTIGNFTSALTS